MMRQVRREDQAGVTLIEVLVALALFSLIGLAGFSMLDNILRVQSGTEGRLERLAQIDRTLVVFTRDLQESAPGSIRQGYDSLRMFRTGTGGLSYQLEDGNLQRRVTRGSFAQTMISGVQAMRFRAIDTDGISHDAWPVAQTQTLGFSPTLMALEMQLDLPEGMVSRLVDLPSERDE